MLSEAGYHFDKFLIKAVMYFDGESSETGRPLAAVITRTGATGRPIICIDRLGGGQQSQP